MDNTNFLQVGEVTACGHCQPDKFGEGLRGAIASGFDETKCGCKCHKQLDNTEYQRLCMGLIMLSPERREQAVSDLLDLLRLK